MRALLRSKMQSRPDARASDRESWPFDQPGRASEHARTAAPFTGATAHCVEHVGRTERLSRRSESRGGSVFEETVGRERERTARSRASLSSRPSARGGTPRGVLARHRLPPVRASGRGPKAGLHSTARIGRVAVKRLAPDRQVLLSQLSSLSLSLCVVRRARVSRRCSTPRAAREGGRERERSENQRSRLVSSPISGINTSRQFHAAVRGPFRFLCVLSQSPTAALVAPPGRARGTERDLRNVNDPSAGSPTETLLRLLLPLNDQVWSSSRQHRQCRRIAAHQSEDLTKSFNR